ncbi:MAG: MerR family transcriptional regulator [Deltaproteobacteria bacterium]|nr:MerR family transcriptional regulator [Deltaproteobacteria bacterium]
MRDLVRETGLPRQTIHFYLSAGLLPRPTKTGRNTALYNQEHVRRARLIKDIQEKHFLPLRAIRALLEDSDDSTLSAAQQSLIKELRVRLGAPAAAQHAQRVSLAEVLEQNAIPATEIAEFRDRGVIAVEGSGSAASVSPEDAQLLHAWARLKAIGISPERGFMPRDLDIIEDAMSRMVRREMEFFTERYAAAGGEEAARVVTEAVPIVNQIISIVHWKKTWAFFAEFTEKDMSIAGRQGPKGA